MVKDDDDDDDDADDDDDDVDVDDDDDDDDDAMPYGAISASHLDQSLIEAGQETSDSVEDMGPSIPVLIGTGTFMLFARYIHASPWSGPGWWKPQEYTYAEVGWQTGRVLQWPTDPENPHYTNPKYYQENPSHPNRPVNDWEYYDDNPTPPPAPENSMEASHGENDTDLKCSIKQHGRGDDAAYVWAYVWRGIVSQYPMAGEVEVDISRCHSINEWQRACSAVLQEKGWSRRAAADICFTIWKRASQALRVLRDHVAGPRWRLEDDSIQGPTSYDGEPDPCILSNGALIMDSSTGTDV